MTDQSLAYLSPYSLVFHMEEGASEIVHGHLKQLREVLTIGTVSASLRRGIVIGEAFMSAHVEGTNARFAPVGSDADHVLDALTIIVRLWRLETDAIPGLPIDVGAIVKHLADYRHALMEMRMADLTRERQGNTVLDIHPRHLHSMSR